MKKQKYHFIKRTRFLIKILYHFTISFLNGLIAEYLDRRMETKNRRWIAVGTLGAGKVQLGIVNMAEATEKTGNFGTVVNVDVEQAVIFYSEKR